MYIDDTEVRPIRAVLRDIASGYVTEESIISLTYVAQYSGQDIQQGLLRDAPALAGGNY